MLNCFNIFENFPYLKFSLFRRSYNSAQANNWPPTKILKCGNSLFSCGAVIRRALDDLRGVIYAHSFQPRLVEPKAEKRRTGRILRRSDDAFSHPLAGSHCFFLLVQRCCSAALSLARTLATLGICGTDVTLEGVTGRVLNGLRAFIDAHSCKSQLKEPKAVMSAKARLYWRSDNAVSGLSQVADSFPFRVECFCFTTDSAGMLAFTFARARATLCTYDTSSSTTDAADVHLWAWAPKHHMGAWVRLISSGIGHRKIGEDEM